MCARPFKALPPYPPPPSSNPNPTPHLLPHPSPRPLFFRAPAGLRGRALRHALPLPAADRGPLGGQAGGPARHRLLRRLRGVRRHQGAAVGALPSAALGALGASARAVVSGAEGYRVVRSIWPLRGQAHKCPDVWSCSASLDEDWHATARVRLLSSLVLLASLLSISIW